MSIDPSRLFTQLQNTGLQNKDNPLYQLIFQLIGILVKLNAASTSGGSAAGTTINQQINQIIGMALDGPQDSDDRIMMLNAVPSSNFITNEVPSGSINGSNTVFTTAANYQSGTLLVYLNGVRQKITEDFTETSANSFTMNAAPLPGDILLVDYGILTTAIIGATGATGPAGPAGLTGTDGIDADNFMIPGIPGAAPETAAVFAYQTTLQSIAQTTETAITFGATVYDTNGFWVSGSTLTVPITKGGKYTLLGQVKFALDGTGPFYLRIYKNGSLIAENFSSVTQNDPAVQVVGETDLVGGDTLVLKVLFTTSGSATQNTVIGSAQTFFAIQSMGGAGANSGNRINSTTVGSEPTANSGDLDLYSNGFAAARYNGTLWIPWGPLYKFTAPVDGDFAWINQGGASVDTTNGGIYLLGPATAGTSWRVRKKSIGANTRLEIGFLPNIFGATPQAGILLRESGTGKLATLAIAAGALQFAIQHWASPTGAATNDLVSQSLYIGMPIWFAVVMSGTNILYQISADGQHWIQVLSIAKATQFTTAPDEWGFTLNAGQNTYNTAITLVSFKES